MDPDACLQRISDAARDSADMREACEDLLTWIQRGGFEPDWEANLKGARRFKKFFGIARL